MEAKHGGKAHGFYSRPPAWKNRIVSPIQEWLENQPDTAPNIARNRGDIQATTKVADCRSLQSSPPKFPRQCVRQVFIQTSQGRFLETFMSASRDRLMGSFCGAGRRCQGRFAPRVVRANQAAQNHLRNMRLHRRKNFASSASIVETQSGWCAYRARNAVMIGVPHLPEPDDSPHVTFFFPRRRCLERSRKVLSRFAARA
jgi:hypothetical protein